MAKLSLGPKIRTTPQRVLKSWGGRSGWWDKNSDRIQRMMGPHEPPCYVPIPHVTGCSPEWLHLKTSFKKIRRVTRSTKQTSGQFTVNTHKTTHFQSCSGHFLSLVITNTYTHNLNPDIMWGEGEKKSDLKDKSAQIGAHTSATMALWNTYNLPKYSASSSTLNSELTNHLQDNWPTQNKPPNFPWNVYR